MAEGIDGGDILIELYNRNQIGQQLVYKEDQSSKAYRSLLEDTQKKIVLDKVPADIDKAKLHALAKRVGKEKDGSKVCECCGAQIDNKPLSIFCDTDDLSLLGPGVPLYFDFIKAAILLLMLLSIVYTSYGLYSNRKGNFCIALPNGVSLPNGSCYKNIFNENSLINKVGDTNQIMIQNYVTIGIVIFLVMALHLYRKQMRQQIETLDAKLTSPSDFTAQLYNLPPQYNEDDVRASLQSWWKNQSELRKQRVGLFYVEKVSIAYDVKEYMQKINLRNSINLQIRKNNSFISKNKDKNLSPPGLSKEELNRKLHEVQKEIDALEKEVLSGKYSKVTQHSFVTFNSRKVMECLIDCQNLSVFQRFMVKLRKCFGSDVSHILQMTKDSSDYIIRVKRAPEPSDVKWENCGASVFSKIFSRLFTWTITIILLGACFTLIYLINKWQHGVNQDNKMKQDEPVVKAELFLLSLFSSFSIVFINSFLNIAIRLLSNMEFQPTVTSLNSSIASKLAIAQFCNSALITLAVNYTIDSDSFWGNGGITNDFTLIALVNCVVPPLLNFFNPFALLRVIKRRTIRVNNYSGQYSQGEANSWYEGGPFEISIKYASCIKTLWMIGFYTPLSPYLPVIGFVALMLNYCMDKYLLLNRLARPSLIGSDLNLEMIELAEYFPFSVAIGNLVWMYKLNYTKGTNLILMLIAVGISAVNFIIPSAQINKLLFKIQEANNSQGLGSYQDSKYKFIADYDRCNPITKEDAIKSFISEVEVFNKEQEKKKLNKQNENNGISKTVAPTMHQYQAAIPSFYQVPISQRQNQSGLLSNGNSRLVNPLLDGGSSSNISFQRMGSSNISNYKN